MRVVLNTLIYLAGLFNLFMAALCLFRPQDMAPNYGIAAIDPMGGTQGVAAGLATIRADCAAFFGVAAFCMIWGVWRRNGDLLLASALLFGIAFVGHAINAVVVGTYPGWLPPMAVEAFHVVILLSAWWLLPHHRAQEIAG